MKIKHCPTKQMLADPLTKPLQGSEFREFRSKMMNVDPTIPDWEMSWDRGETFAKSADLRPQECVGLQGILREPTHKNRRATRGSAVPVAE